ncbi:MAG: galactose-1-phosphate uridylyltransferase [Planctomycetes bacterium]|nr:galactose-1-phosphate uridylyltransferase [Planctomycetota bacterium]
MIWEQRWHPLREEWVIVAAHRQDRPWVGETLPAGAGAAVPAHDPACSFCPGNTRVSGKRNPPYRGVFVFDNDHPCVGEDAPADLEAPSGLNRNRPATGVARVVCYTPRHDLSLALLAEQQVDELLEMLGAQYAELAGRAGIEHVLVFENRGEVVGVSNPHPHCQIYATNFVFKTIAVEREACRRHFHETGRVLFQDILEAEAQDGRRILFENDSAIAFVPYFARYAYEVFVAPKAAHPSLATLSGAERRDLARVLKRVLVRFDNLWRAPFPYVMPLHQAPADGGDASGFHFHVEFHPPLRRKNLLKYLAGPEIGGGNFLSDTCPEEKAAELRALSDLHYRAAEAAP